MSTHEIERPAAELLQELRDLSEHERIEAKRASSIQRSTMETVCAFCNEPDLGGGWLLLGVEEDESKLFPDLKVVGVDDMDKLQNDLLSLCRSTFNVPVTVRMNPERAEGSTLLKVFVPEADVSVKPIYFQNKGLPKGAFRRTGSGDVQCSEEDLLVLYSGRNNESYDRSILKDADWDDFDPDAIEEYRRDRHKANPHAEELAWTDEELLHSLGCLKKINSLLKPTVAGILLFGSKMALRRLFPMMRVDYIRVPGKEWVSNPDAPFDSLDMRDSLMRVARRAQNAIRDDLIESFSLPEGEMQRQTQRAIPDRVIREAVVNALVHRSYTSHSPIQIIRFSDRLEIRNAGYSLKNEEHLGLPGSQPRNPTLAAVLHDTHFAENKGSGIRVMREKMREAGLTPPFFESNRTKNEFTARFLFHHFLSEADVHWLAQYKGCNLADEDARALIFVREQGRISNADYRDLNVIDTLTASKHLKRLCALDLLEKKGQSISTYYVAGPKFLPMSTQENGKSALSEEQNALTPDLTRNISGQSGGLNSQHGGGQNGLSSDLQDLSSDLTRMISGLSPDLQDELHRKIPEYRRDLGKRGDAAIIRRIIVDLCELQPWTDDDLALFIGRTAKYIRQNFLAPMVSDGLLERTHPENLNHPQQAYRTKTETPKTV